MTLDRTMTVSFDHQGTGREAGYAARVLISSKSSYLNAPLFLDAISQASCAASPAIFEWLTALPRMAAMPTSPSPATFRK
jgi:hypothetical protein